MKLPECMHGSFLSWKPLQSASPLGRSGPSAFTLFVSFLCQEGTERADVVGVGPPEAKTQAQVSGGEDTHISLPGKEIAGCRSPSIALKEGDVSLSWPE